MAATGSSAGDEAIHGINVTPLVDIMLVLLIIFMVAGRLESSAAVPVELPRASTGAAAEPTTLAVVAGAGGQILLDGAPVALTALESRVRAALRPGRETRAMISADRRLAYEQVMQVVDALRRAGVEKLGFSVTRAGGAP
jgi:biopolymer transport protein ExbD